MDIYTLIAIPSASDWQLNACEAEQKNKLVEVGVEPIAYQWNKHVRLEPRPITKEIAELLSDESDRDSWKCFVLKGDFLNKIEEEVNQWVDEWEVEYTSFIELLEQVYENQKRVVFAFERNSETIDSLYANKSSHWIYEKIRGVLDRKQKLEGFAVIKGVEMAS